MRFILQERPSVRVRQTKGEGRFMREKAAKRDVSFSVKNEDYQTRVKEHTPRSRITRDCLKAFFIGGDICAAGEAIAYLYQTLGATEEDAYPLVTVTLIFLSALLTGIGVYDRIARHGGAGTLIPVTGFANAVVSPAIDTKSEGVIVGVGAKIFTVAGPVILYSVLTGSLYGAILYIVGYFKNM